MKIKVMGHNYELELIKGFLSNLKTNPNQNFGRCEHIHRIIQTDPEIEGFFEIILHEICHILDDKLELGFDENTIQRFSEGLYCVLKDNKWIPENIEELILLEYNDEEKEINSIVEEISNQTIKRLKGEYERT